METGERRVSRLDRRAQKSRTEGRRTSGYRRISVDGQTGLRRLSQEIWKRGLRSGPRQQRNLRTDQTLIRECRNVRTRRLAEDVLERERERKQLGFGRARTG